MHAPAAGRAAGPGLSGLSRPPGTPRGEPPRPV